LYTYGSYVVLEVSLYGGRMTSTGKAVPAATRKLWDEGESKLEAESNPCVGNGLIPSWNFEMFCLLWHPTQTFLVFSVYRQKRRTMRRRELIAYEVIPAWCLRGGYRSVQLRSPSGSYIRDCALLVYIQMRQCAFQYPPAESIRRAPSESERVDRNSLSSCEGGSPGSNRFAETSAQLLLSERSDSRTRLAPRMAAGRGWLLARKAIASGRLSRVQEPNTGPEPETFSPPPAEAPPRRGLGRDPES